MSAMPPSEVNRQNATHDRGGVLVDLVSGALDARVIAFGVSCKRQGDGGSGRSLNDLAPVHRHAHLDIGRAKGRLQKIQTTR
jgi:hypothetical protein